METDSEDFSKILAGFTVILGPNNWDVLVPTFLVPATQLALDKEKVQDALDIDNATGGVSTIKGFYNFILTNSEIKPWELTNASFVEVGEAELQIPTDPVSPDFLIWITWY